MGNAVILVSEVLWAAWLEKATHTGRVGGSEQSIRGGKLINGKKGPGQCWVPGSRAGKGFSGETRSSWQSHRAVSERGTGPFPEASSPLSELSGCGAMSPSPQETTSAGGPPTLGLPCARARTGPLYQPAENVPCR